MTQQALADKLGIHWITVSKLERGVMQLTFSWLTKISDALGVTPNELWIPSQRNFFEVTFQLMDDGRIESLEPGQMLRLTTFEPIAHSDNLKAIVDTKALEPFFGPGDILIFGRAPSESDEIDGSYEAYMRGRLCATSAPSGGVTLATFDGVDKKGQPWMRLLNGRKYASQIDKAVLYLESFLPAWVIEVEKSEHSQEG